MQALSLKKLLQHPHSVFEQLHGAAVAALAGDVAVFGTDHDILMDGRLVHAAGQQLFLGQGRAALGGAGIAGTEGDVAGRVFIEQGL